MADHIAPEFFEASNFLPRLELQWCATTDGFWAWILMTKFKSSY